MAPPPLPSLIDRLTMPDLGTRFDLPDSGTATLTLPHPAHDGARVTLTLGEDAVEASMNGERTTLTPQTGPRPPDLPRSVLLMDLTFDGYTDIGILESSSSQGRHLTWSFFRADKEQLFVPLTLLTNPRRDVPMRTVSANEPAAMFPRIAVYDAGEAGLRRRLMREVRYEYDIITFAGESAEPAASGIIGAAAPNPITPEEMEQPVFWQEAQIKTEDPAGLFEAPNSEAALCGQLAPDSIIRIVEVSQFMDWFAIATKDGTTGWARADDMVLLQGLILPS